MIFGVRIVHTPQQTRDDHSGCKISEKSQKNCIILMQFFAFYITIRRWVSRPCHPERSKQLSIVCEVEPDREGGCALAQDLRAKFVPLVDPQNAASVLTRGNFRCFAHSR